MMLRIRLAGLERYVGDEADKLVLVGTTENGVITTPERYEEFRISLAHVKDNAIWHFGEKIGDVSQMEFI